MRRIDIVFVVAGTLALASCGAFTSHKETLPGQRISVLELERQLTPDPSLADLPIALPRPAPEPDWPQSGGDPDHAMGHPTLPDKLDVAWHQSIGEGASRHGLVLASPVIQNGMLYTMDALTTVTAWSLADGQKKWEFDDTPKDDESQAWGGGIAYDSDRIYVSSGFGQVIALEAATGKEIWRVSTESPVRSAPTVADGRLFVITVDNQMLALLAQDGSRLWNYDGVPESAQLAGGASPAVEGEVVVAPFSSGEIVALRVENGRPLWSESLAATRRFDPMATLADIRAAPVIDRGRVYAVSHSGRMAAIDLRTGERIWEQEVGGSVTPWVVGDYVYVLSSTAELVCLERQDGRVKWIRQLDRYEDPSDKSDPIEWAGPVLAGDRLIALASTGEAWSISPYTGDVLSHIELPAGTFLPPIVASDTLVIETADGDLMALR